jgi:flagellar biosynthetic protein FliR
MGLSFAFNVDPLRGSSTAALGQLYIILATLVFLALGGHLAIVQVLVDGLHAMPIGTGLDRQGLWALVLWGGTLFSGAISIALPGVTALLIVNLAFGVVSRAAPALNLFAVGFPIALIVGLVVVLAGMGPLTEGITQLIGQGLEFLRDLSGV